MKTIGTYNDDLSYLVGFIDVSDNGHREIKKNMRQGECFGVFESTKGVFIASSYNLKVKRIIGTVKNGRFYKE